MGGEGFEPSKAMPADLQSVPFGHSGIHPYCPVLPGGKSKADDRTRTDNLLITNQLLCQLSHIGKNRNEKETDNFIVKRPGRDLNPRPPP